MAEKKKLDKKVVLIVLLATVIAALVVILATCAMFDQKPVEVNKTDWARVVKDSSWTFNKKSVADSSKLVPALRDIISLDISSDGTLNIKYGTYNFSAGTVVFAEDYSSGSLSIRQASADGYVTNNLRLTFSNQEEKTYDQNSYVLTVEVEGVGSLYFFKN